MAKMVVAVDASDYWQFMEENAAMFESCRDRLPLHLTARIERLNRCPALAIDTDIQGDIAIMSPSAELLAVVASMRRFARPG